MSAHGSCNGCGKGFGLFTKEVSVAENIMKRKPHIYANCVQRIIYTYLVLFLTAKIIGVETHGCIKYFEANKFGRIDIKLKSDIYGVESKLIVTRTCIKVVCRLKFKPFSNEVFIMSELSYPPYSASYSEV